MALHYILDGYNVIKCVDGLADLALEQGRKELFKILEVQRPQGSLRNRVTIVFDGKADIWSPSPASVAKVVFTSGETADDYIKRLIEDDKDIKNVIVVTNDGEIVCYVRNLGARTLSVHDFLMLKSSGQAGKGIGRGVSIDQQKQRHITRVMEARINKELEDVWINKDKPQGAR